VAGGARHLRCQLRPADGNPSPFLNTNVNTNLDPGTDVDVDADAHRDADVDAKADAHRDADVDAHSLLGHTGLHARGTGDRL
jgi:hypothetical protein